MREVLAEVFTTIKGNRMRIALTGFSIAWGIFIFIVLISSGRGLLNGMNYNFKSYNVGVVTLTPRETSQPYQGRGRGRTIRLYEEDAKALELALGDMLKKSIPVISHAVQARRGKDYTNTLVDGYAPDYDVAPNIRIIEGRDINDLDMIDRRKVCVIPRLLKDVFFGNGRETAIGQEIMLNGINFRVIGVYEPMQASNPIRSIVAPLTTVKMIWCPEGQLSHIYLETANLTSSQKNQQFNARILKELATRKEFAPTDKHAVKIDNIYELPVMLSNIMSGLGFFVIVVGLAMLMSGIVGVSNIMLISVRERTREIGIRRAVGAKAYQIIILVLTESVIICLLFGYVGMMIGIGLMELVSRIIVMAGGGNIFSNPTVSPVYVLIVGGIMVLAGIIAGYIPAKQASGIKIVDALIAQ